MDHPNFDTQFLRQSRRRFTLVEVLVGLGLLAIGLFPIAASFFESYRQAKKLYQRNEALEKLNERMIALLNLNFEENYLLPAGQNEAKYEAGGGKTEAMKEILKDAPSSQFSTTLYKFSLKLNAVPQSYPGYGVTGLEIVKDTRNFTQILLTLEYKEDGGNDKTMTLCSRLGQRSL